MTITKDGVVAIDDAFSTDTGIYMCVAVNDVRSVSASIDVEVLGKANKALVHTQPSIILYSTTRHAFYTVYHLD